MQAHNGNLLVSSLRSAGCVRIAVSDPKYLNEQRQRVAAQAARLGRSVNCSYRHPWLYVTLGDKLDEFRETTVFKVLEAA